MAAAFFIWYPLQNVKGAKADIEDLPHPSTFLQGDDLNGFNAIETHAREYLLSEALPQLIDEVMDLGQEPTQADVEFLTTKLVRLFKETHDGIEAQRTLMMSGTRSSGSAATKSLGSPCSYTSTL